ncbi:HAD family hydrolase [Agreia sp. COWG]|uniref:HAD family hydrolase n=1 Tax=Agreia sp. COWG TaxID=2773266 RepID=UPI00192916BF|nr:HAD family hydrolase [Agreia sp. COWG]CAD6009931.1 conserved protein of unknown function [Agreia sp. COWG]
MSGVELPAGLRAVVFDVGETLVDETRAWSFLAERAGVTPFTLMGVVGALIARGEDHRRAWDVLGVDRPAESPSIVETDLYPDALDCLQAARAAGLVVGIAGNQPAAAEEHLRAAGFQADFVATSARWNVAKPSAAFFAKVAEAAGVDAAHILYIGDRLDNDIVPAAAFGMRTAFVRRGPWGVLQAQQQTAVVADVMLDSLEQLTSTFLELR